MALIYPLGTPALYGYLLFYKYNAEIRKIESIEVMRKAMYGASQAEKLYIVYMHMCMHAHVHVYVYVCIRVCVRVCLSV